jgi:hypothetical protein
MPAAESDPLEIFRTLEEHGIRYVLIGAAAARLAGAPVVTEHVDVTPATDRANLERLAAALRRLDARLRSAADPEGVPFPADAELLARADTWTLTTTAGDLDICFTPAGTRGYSDLRREATRERLGKGVDVMVASLRDVIRSNEAAGRDKDLAQLPLLRRTLEEIRERGRPGRERVGRVTRVCAFAKRRLRPPPGRRRSPRSTGLRDQACPRTAADQLSY